ncbi:MAG: ABC transporter ATP-binding protein [Myxococcales bacterium]|nr:ABC transporter ATP-binding protein [Myxococcales bacterium]
MTQTSHFPTAFQLVEARNVTKIFGRHRALHNVSLTIPAGSVTALLGPNGAGKTTLLSIFSTLTRPTHGAVHFDDWPPERAHQARGRIGLVSHAALTYGELSAAENLRFFAKLHGASDPAAEAMFWLDHFELQDAADRLAKTFSRGMRQRLGLARALIGCPGLLLLDEPFSGLDRASREIALRAVDDQRARGVMTVVVSHDLGLSAELADHYIVLKRGRIVAEHTGRLGTPELRQLYANAAEDGRRLHSENNS